jgi:PilZ domain-containing protein
VRVLDVSPAGMSLVAPHPLDRGALLNVELPGSDELFPRHVLIRVVTNRPFDSDQWLLGCELAAQISDEELQSFQ